MWVLKSYQSPIPNNYFYVQRTGIYQTFAANAIIEEVAKAVSSFRIANKLPRASLAESLEDVDTFNCEVRQNDPRYCRECVTSFEQARQTHRFVSKTCGSCGTAVKSD